MRPYKSLLHLYANIFKNIRHIKIHSNMLQNVLNMWYDITKEVSLGMFTDVIAELEGDQKQKMFLHRMAKLYEEHLPETLYMNHYQLAETFGFTPREWDEFLKIDEIDRLIELEIVQIAEVGARRALERLQSGHANSADVSAARELLATTRLLKMKNNQRPQVIITRIPPKEVEGEEVHGT